MDTSESSTDISGTGKLSITNTDVGTYLLPKKEENIRNSVNSDPGLRDKTSTHPLGSPFRLNLRTWLFAFVTGVWLFMAILYAWAVSVTTGPLTKLVPPSETLSLNILRICSEIAGILLASLAISALSVGLWAIASSDDGISTASLLGMSSSTGVSGLIRLLCWQDPSKGRRTFLLHRFWVGQRFLLILIIPLMDIIITSQVTSTTLYTPVVNFPASAGLGVFNASFSIFTLPSLLDLELLTQASNFFNNPQRTYSVDPFSRNCNGSTCASFLFVGRLDTISPSPYLIAHTSEVDAIGVRGERSVQADYWSVSPSEAAMTSQDCQTWGLAGGEAFMMCIKQSSLDETRLVAALSICPLQQSSSCLSDTTWQQSVQLSTSLAFSYATAKTAYSPLNGTLLAVTNITQVEPAIISPSDLFFAMNRFIQIPLNDSGATEVSLINYIAVYLNHSLTSQSPYDNLAAQTSFKLFSHYRHYGFRQTAIVTTRSKSVTFLCLVCHQSYTSSQTSQRAKRGSSSRNGR